MEPAHHGNLVVSSGAGARQVRGPGAGTTSDRRVTDLVRIRHRDDTSTDTSSSDDSNGEVAVSEGMATMRSNYNQGGPGTEVSLDGSSRSTPVPGPAPKAFPKGARCGGALCGGALCGGSPTGSTSSRSSWSVTPMGFFFGGDKAGSGSGTSAPCTGSCGAALLCGGGLRAAAAKSSPNGRGPWVCAVLPVDSGSEGEGDGAGGEDENSADGGRPPVALSTSCASTSTPPPGAVGLVTEAPSTLGSAGETRSEPSNDLPSPREVPESWNKPCSEGTSSQSIAVV